MAGGFARQNCHGRYVMLFCHRSLILSTPNALKVLGERGLVHIKGRGLGDVHERLLPHLQQGVAPSALMAAMPKAWREPVSSYFKGLITAGVLRTERSEIPWGCLLDGQDPDDRSVFRDTAVGLRRLCLVGRIDTDLISGHDLVFLILPKTFLGKVLLRVRELSALGSGLVVFLVDDTSSNLAVELASHRAFFSRWIRLKTHHHFTVNTGWQVWVEDVDASSCRCRPLLRLTAHSRGWSEDLNNRVEWLLYEQIPLISVSSLDQLPLCSMKSNPDIFPFQLRCFGTEAAILAQQVRNRLTLACLQRWPELVRTSFRSGALHCEMLRAGAHVYDIVPDLICDFWLKKASPLMKARKLLAENSDDHRFAYLERLLAIVGHEGVVSYGRTANGLHVFGHGSLVLGSFHERQACYRMLLALVVEAFYGLVVKPAELDASWRPFASRTERKRLSRRLLQTYGDQCRFGKLELWGKRLWVGGLLA